LFEEEARIDSPSFGIYCNKKMALAGQGIYRVMPGNGHRAMAQLTVSFQSATIPLKQFLGPARQASFGSQPGTADPQGGKIHEIPAPQRSAFSPGPE
jgi:hypothetical protein